MNTSTTIAHVAAAGARPYSYPLGLFAGFGVELEYMIVDRRTLDPSPIADRLFRAAAGHDAADVEPDGPDGVIGWSNELVLHVAELKTIRPVASLEGLGARFQDHVARMNGLLEPMNARLLPTGMHPWLDPHQDVRLWAAECGEIYAAYDRIFGCRGHGWGNLQSTHVNLPFANDEEFGRLHAAIRLVLPLIPAIAASSPIVGGHWVPIADHRLEVYRTNSQRVPMMAGMVIPEPAFTRAEYERQILQPLYDELAPLDPDGVLRYEWANARGCIARFDRGSIEIRLIDAQECPAADVAVVAFVAALVRAMVEERWAPYAQQMRAPTAGLHRVLLETIRYAERTRIHERSLLEAFGIARSMAWGDELLMDLAEQVLPEGSTHAELVRSLLSAGTLATRIGKRVRRFPTRAELHEVYEELAGCLAAGSLFGVG